MSSKYSARKFAESQDAIRLRPGFVALDCSRATGGVTYEQTRHAVITEATRANGTEVVSWSTRRTVDHKQVVADMDALVKRVDYLLRVNCSRAGWGWFADADAAAKVRHGMDLLQDQAEELNATARRLGSARRVHLSLILVPLDVTNSDVAQEIYRSVLATLQGIHECLRAGMVGSELDKHLLRARNMGNVAVGITSAALTDALGRVPEWRNEVRTAVKGGVDAALAGQTLQLDALDAAIQLFSPFTLGQE